MNTISKSTWLQPLQICMAQGAATGNVHFFESEQDHKNFLYLWNKYLGGMTELIQYSFTSTQWMVLFKTKSTNAINEAYQKQRSKSLKAKPSSALIEPSRMLSEHFRICLSLNYALDHEYYL